jgi:hypothetical protein
MCFTTEFWCSCNILWFDTVTRPRIKDWEGWNLFLDIRGSKLMCLGHKPVSNVFNLGTWCGWVVCYTPPPPLTPRYLLDTTLGGPWRKPDVVRQRRKTYVYPKSNPGRPARVLLRSEFELWRRGHVLIKLLHSWKGRWVVGYSRSRL